MKKFNLVFIIMLMVFVAACSNKDDKGKENESDSTKEKDELVLALGGEPEDGFDPTTGWGMYRSPLFQSTLLRYDKDFVIENDLAVDYTISEDALTYTVDIREDVQFSDGEQLTAKDVVFTFETAKSSGSIVDLNTLEHVKAIGDYTVEFQLKQPESSFITHLTTMGIVPEHAYSDTYNEHPIGSGPYQMRQWDKGQQLIVEANPNYYGKKPKFTKLTFLFLEEDATFAATKAGEVDVAAITPNFAKHDIKGMRLVELDTVDNRGIVFPYVKAGNESEEGYPIGNDVTSDVAIRKAIDVGVNREALVNGVLEGYGTPASSVADRLPWWNEETMVEDNDVEKAKQLLDEAGWIERDDGIREKDGIEASFDLLYPAGDEVRQSLSIAVADQIKALGIRVKTEGKNWSDLERFRFSTPIMMGWGSHDPLEMYNIYSSDTRGQDFYNISYYSNPKVDEYMEKALRAITQEEAYDNWQKAQWDGETGFSSKGDAPWVWLVNLQHVYFVKENLVIGDQKIHPHGHGWPITDFIEGWHWE